LQKASTQAACSFTGQYQPVRVPPGATKGALTTLTTVNCTASCLSLLPRISSNPVKDMHGGCRHCYNCCACSPHTGQYPPVRVPPGATKGALTTLTTVNCTASCLSLLPSISSDPVNDMHGGCRHCYNCRACSPHTKSGVMLPRWPSVPAVPGQ
jgi:hypothetical protein